MHMLRSHHQRIIQAGLPVRYTHSNGWQWWLHHTSHTTATASATETAEKILSGHVSQINGTLKSTDKKTVFRLSSAHAETPDVIGKFFQLRKFEHKLKYQRYALNEAANLILAQKKGIRIAPVRAYGHTRDCFGLVSASMVLLEYLEGYSPVGVLLESCAPSERIGVLNRTIPVFVSLYHAGCNHIDVNQGAILLSTQSDSLAAILDFQHAQFHDSPRPEILMFEAGYFAQSCSGFLSEDDTTQWLHTLFDAISVQDQSTKRRLTERFYYYANTTLSRKQRALIR